MKNAVLPLAILVLDAAVCVAAVIAGGRRPEKYFDEGTFLTWLNGMQLVALAAIGLAVFLLNKSQASPFRAGARFWLLVAIGALFLSIDEVFLLHETAGHYIEDVLRLPKPGGTKYDDILALAYVPVALGVSWVYRAEIIRDRGVLAFFLGGVVLLGFSQALDTFGWMGTRDHTQWIPEESSKILGFGAILGGALLQLQVGISAIVESASQPEIPWTGNLDPAPA